MTDVVATVRTKRGYLEIGFMRAAGIYRLEAESPDFDGLATALLRSWRDGLKIRVSIAATSVVGVEPAD